jgi:branched-chain amino acid transport system substrate-binding protein
MRYCPKWFDTVRQTTRRSVLKGLGAGTTAGIAGLAGCSASPPGQGGGNGSGSGNNGSGNGSSGSGGGGGGSSSFKVGVLGPLSGPFAGWGQAEITGARLAKEDLESEFDTSIEIVTGDTETSPDAGLEAMQRLVRSENVDFTQGGVSSAVCTQMGSWASDNGVSYIASGASDTLTGSACSKYMYSVYASNTMQAQAAIPGMVEEAKKWYLLYSDYTWGQTGQQVFTKGLENNGASVVGKDAVPFPADDFTQYINNVSNSDATGVGLINPGLDARLAMKQLMNNGLHKELTIMVHQFEPRVLWGLNKQAAAALDTSPMGWSAALDGVDSFCRRVAGTGQGVNPFVRHYMGYVALDQHVRAAIRAGSSDAEAIRGELEGHEVSGPSAALQPGRMHWRACDHQLIQPVHTATGRKVKNMQDEPYRLWFNLESTVPGGDVARSCEATGCSF